jgi:hypothetical protein
MWHSSGSFRVDSHGTHLAPPFLGRSPQPKRSHGRCSLSDAGGEERYRPYRDAIRRRVCAICLDGTDDGACGLSGPLLCGIAENIARLVDAILEARGRRDGAYAAAVEAKVCSPCPHRDELGLCRLRRDGHCAVNVYLPLVIEAIEEVERRHEGGTA